MKSIVIPNSGPPTILSLQEKTDLTPKGDELRIRVKAAGINFADIMARKGLYPDAPPFPCVVGYEVAGVVDEVGPDADSKWLNKPVVAVTRFGGYADMVCVPEERCFEKPEGLSFPEAASLPVVYLTAWMLIYHMGGLRKDQTLLIQNAGGGVGLAAINIAKYLGAKTIGTASGHKHDFLKKRGLDHAIDYRKEDVHEKVMAIEKNGVDLIIDPIGGDEWKKNYKLLRAGGRLGMFGASTLTDAAERNIITKAYMLISFFLRIPKWSPLNLMDENKSVFGANLGKLFNDDRIREWFNRILQGVEDGWVRPVVDKVFSFEDASKAHEYIEARKNIGKVMLVPTRVEVEEFEKNQ